MRAVIFAVLAAFFAAPAMAQIANNCAPREIMIERLASGFGETRQSIGLGAQGSVVEVFASLETGTWTIVVTAPSGVTCMAAVGRSFERVDELPPAEGAPI